MRARLRRWSARADRVGGWGGRALRGRGMRRLWLVGASLVAVAGLAFGTLQAASLVAHEEHDEVEVVDAAGVASLAVDNGAGSVTLIGADDADAITVRARISEGLRATGHRVTVRDDVLLVRGTCPILGSEWCGVDYTIELPADMYASVSGRDGVSATDLDGGLRASSETSGVELLRVGGDVALTADQGRIEADDLRSDRVTARADQGRISLAFAASPRQVEARADQGSIDIVLPDEPGVYFAVADDVDQGTLRSGVRERSDSDRSITVQADQGNVTIGYGAG